MEAPVLQRGPVLIRTRIRRRSDPVAQVGGLAALDHRVDALSATWSLRGVTGGRGGERRRSPGSAQAAAGFDDL